MKTYDVGIVGVGTMGSMAAWQIAKSGLSVIGFEQFGIGHDNGAGGGETRIFRTIYKEGAEYVALLRQAQKLWRDLEREANTKILNLNGFLTIGAEGDPYLEGVMACLRNCELDAEILTREQAISRFPAINAGKDELTVLDKDGGLLKPELAVMSAATRAEALGATLLRHCPVRSIESDTEGVWIETAQGLFRVRKLIVTAGAWAGKFLPEGLVKPHRVSLSWFLAKQPELFSGERFPSSNRTLEGVGISLFTSQDGTTVKVGCNGSVGELETADQVRIAPHPEEKKLSSIIAQFYPGMWPEPIRTTSYTDGFTADHHGVVGSLPGTENILIAAGFSAHGFKMAPAIGVALAALVQGKTPEVSISHLSPDRFAKEFQR